MIKLRFWQKTYLFTLLLFLVALYGGMFFMGWKNQTQTLNSELEKVKSEQQFIAQNFARDLGAIKNNTHMRIPALAKSYGGYYSQEGILLEVDNGKEILHTTLPNLTDADMNWQLENGQQNWVVHRVGGKPYIFVTSRLEGEYTDYTMVIARSLSPLYHTWEQMNRVFAFGSIVISVLLAIGLFFVLRGLSKPMEDLAVVADEFADGNLGTRAQKRGDDEIGNLADSFNHMAETVQQNILDIQKTADQNERMAANLSHEIRTPLTAIQGYAEYMRMADLTPEEQDISLKYIIDESQRLQKISQRMLQLASLKHGQIKMHPVEMEEIIQQVLLTIKSKADSKNITIHLAITPAITVLGDAILLESLLMNLLDNSIHACTEKGEVYLTVQKCGDTAVLTIEDNGCGIERQEIEKIGEVFYRPDSARSRRDGGAGIGVALCYEIAKLHGAVMSFNSILEQGTTVTLEFTAL